MKCQVKKLTLSRFPKMFSEILQTNHYLKLFSVLSFAISFVTSLTLTILVLRGPEVVTLHHDGSLAHQTELPRPQDEVIEATKYYLNKRYHWTPQNVEQKLKETEFFIARKVLDAYKTAAKNIIKFSKEKNVSQKIYPEEFKVDLNNQSVLITGDRISKIQDMRAVGDLKLELSYESGPRSLQNPWGIYIIKEKEN